MYEKILLTTDGSEGSENAAEHAWVIARKFNSMIYVISVMETRPTSGLTTEVLKKESDVALENISQIFKDLEKDPSSKTEIEKSYMIKEGSASQQILKTAEEENIDMIVMGASGKHRLERFILGSVAEKVVRGAKCPVLTVH